MHWKGLNHFTRDVPVVLTFIIGLEELNLSQAAVGSFDAMRIRNGPEMMYVKIAE